MICDLLALRPISHITQKTLSYLHSTKIEQMTKTMVIFKTGAIFLCCIRSDPIPRQTSVQRRAHTRNVTTCCFQEQCIDHIPYYLWGLSRALFFPTTFLEIAVARLRISAQKLVLIAGYIWVTRSRKRWYFCTTSGGTSKNLELKGKILEYLRQLS